MSWIKKLFQMFKNDEEQYESNEEYINHNEIERSTRIQQQETSKDINAKIVYQYPKGEFRFPLIPDEHHVRKPRERRMKQEESAESAEIPRSRESRKERQHTSFTEKKVQAEAKTFTTERDIPQRKGPFRPSEIPSPIFGFEQRPKTVETHTPVEQVPVEFELPDHLDEDKTDIHVAIEKRPTDYPSWFDETLIDNKNILEEEANMLIVEQPDEAEVLTPHSHLEKITDQTPDNNTEEAEEQLEELNQSIEVYNDEPLKEDYLKEENKDGHEESILAEVEDLELIEQKEAELVENKVSELNEHTEPKQEVEEIHLNDSNETILNHDILDQPNKTPDFPEQTSNTNEGSAKELPITVNQEAAKQESALPARKHIPFNVIMLKNDKQKIVEKISPLPTPRVNKVVPFVEKETIIAVEEVAPALEEELPYYQFPAKSLLSPSVHQEESSDWFNEQKELLNSTLINFNVRASVVNVTQGPSVTRFEVQPEPGVKVNKITNLSDDIKLSLAARDIRMEAPIPGKHTIGIEVPNKTSRPVFISEIINSPEFSNSSSPLTAVLGLDIAGNPIVTDLRKMPHGLIAGATGSGKSVCINTILVSLLYKATPDELKLLLIDPKMVELAPYNRIPHLVSPVITDVKAATAALKWAVDEMERRYELFAHTGVRDIGRFNELADEHKRYAEKLPYMVIIIDELADLMMMSPADVEEAICRIAQKARACGIHLIIATQRPSVDVITGLIKANVPTRIAFSVSSQIDSRTIIDISGAEKLLGRGDMLFLENGSSKPVRLQGTYVADQEIDDVVAHVRRERDPEYLFEQEELLKKAQVTEEEDELFYEACEFVIDQGAASTSSLQRRFKIGYNRAARLIDMMEKQGFISETRGSKPREVLITASELESLLDTSTIN
ncbi:DNA translocase FtsK [Cytobacillus depressus]|uniref:DNA translocase FtsK n=1 Tax=Cytobacillus depressus TaxID=1602942 RepID=A0A6L3VBA4_9BACI|nr:DNA translocase FtsK [Cytobacillus depressus]KAB2338870.1 DNA translocase FtsK [Cytobacillus depressus]